MSSTDKTNLDLLNTKVPTIENKITDLSDKINNLNPKGDTDSRPTLLDTDEGFEYYDTTLKKKILWNGTAWVNLDGTELAQ